MYRLRAFESILRNTVGMNDSSCRSSQFDSIIVPAMTDHEKELYNMSLSRHFYVTGTPFVKVESPHFVDSQQKLKADVPKVTRHDLAGELLDNCFDDIDNCAANKVLGGFLRVLFLIFFSSDVLRMVVI